MMQFRVGNAVGSAFFEEGLKDHEILALILNGPQP
jgi:hypothetical protein